MYNKNFNEEHLKTLIKIIPAKAPTDKAKTQVNKP